MTPIEPPSPHPDDGLALIVEEQRCICGHRWTHSYVVKSRLACGPLGGSILPRELHLPFRYLTKWDDREHPGCVRCVPLKTGVTVDLRSATERYSQQHRTIGTPETQGGSGNRTPSGPIRKAPPATLDDLFDI